MTKVQRTIGRNRRVVTEAPQEPELYVKLPSSTEFAWQIRYARARIRVKNGKYLYLFWRDGDTVKNFYLGKKRSS